MDHCTADLKLDLFGIIRKSKPVVDFYNAKITITNKPTFQLYKMQWGSLVEGFDGLYQPLW